MERFSMSEAVTHKVAIVTGSARGIGRRCALSLAEMGYAIALVDLLETEIEATAKDIRATGVEAQTFIADVADHGRAAEIVGAVIGRWGRIDALVNIAGRPMPKGILEIAEDEFDHTIAVNLKSCFNYIQATAPTMLARGSGRIVCMSSLNAFSGGVTAAVSRFAYAAAKGGIVSMVRSLAKELGPAVLVNAVCPGLIMVEGGGNPVIRARGQEIAANGIALRRIGTPEDVAQVVKFLVTSDPCFVTGQSITIDGFQYQM
jgi:3-oxoacyl-[acyl-carrier protein] reductase